MSHIHKLTNYVVNRAQGYEKLVSLAGMWGNVVIYG